MELVIETYQDSCDLICTYLRTWEDTIGQEFREIVGSKSSTI